MSTVVAIMDHPHWSALTDNIVVVEPRRRRLIWVPRDLWCPALGERINGAYRGGGHAALVEALAEHRIAVEHSICLTRAATERVISGLRVTVPVRRRLAFWYPVDRNVGVESGRKPIDFDPPYETLAAERIHQWLGARYERESGRASDLARIGRQQLFIQALLAQGFDFGALLTDETTARVSSPQAIAEASQVRNDWEFGLVPRLASAHVGDKQVLVTRRGPLPVGVRGAPMVRRASWLHTVAVRARRRFW